MKLIAILLLLGAFFEPCYVATISKPCETQPCLDVEWMKNRIFHVRDELPKTELIKCLKNMAMKSELTHDSTIADPVIKKLNLDAETCETDLLNNLIRPDSKAATIENPASGIIESSSQLNSNTQSLLKSLFQRLGKMQTDMRGFEVKMTNKIQDKLESLVQRAITNVTSEQDQKMSDLEDRVEKLIFRADNHWESLMDFKIDHFVQTQLDKIISDTVKRELDIAINGRLKNTIESEVDKRVADKQLLAVDQQKDQWKAVQQEIQRDFEQRLSAGDKERQELKDQLNELRNSVRQITQPKSDHQVKKISTGNSVGSSVDYGWKVLETL